MFFLPTVTAAQSLPDFEQLSHGAKRIPLGAQSLRFAPPVKPQYLWKREEFNFLG